MRFVSLVVLSLAALIAAAPLPAPEVRVHVHTRAASTKLSLFPKASIERRGDSGGDGSADW